MKNKKTLDFIIRYLENEIPNGCRKERPIEKIKNCSVDVLEVLEDPLLLIAKHKNSSDETILYYLYNNKIYVRTTNMHYCGKSVPMNIKQFMDSIYQSAPKESLEVAISSEKQYQERFNSIIIVGNYFYEESKLPFYEVERVRHSSVCQENILSTIEAHSFPDYYSALSSTFQKIFSANEYETAKNYLKALKNLNGNGTRQIGSKIALYNLDKIPAEVFKKPKFNILENKVFFVWEETSLGFVHSSDLMTFEDAKNLFNQNIKKKTNSLFVIRGILLTNDGKQLNKISLISYYNQTLWINNDYESFDLIPSEIDVILKELKNI